MAWPLIPVQIHIATKDDAGAWADAIANSPRLNVSEFPALPSVAQGSREGGCPSLPTLPADLNPPVHEARCD